MKIPVPAPLFALLRKRIDGRSTEEAENVLREDGAALDSWLSAPEQKNDPLHFASVFLCMMSPSELVAVIQEEAKRLSEPQPVAEMDLLEGARLRKDRLISFKKLLVALDAVSEEAAAKFAAEEASDEGVQIEVLPVRFGQVSGTKFLRRLATPLGSFKEVRYVLNVPGGHIYASAFPVGKNVDESNWDESALEASFHTLQVVGKRSSEYGTAGFED